MNCPWLNKVSFNPSAAVGGRVNTNKPVRGSNGTFFCKTSDILDEWKEFFSSLLNGTSVVNPPEIEERHDLDSSTPSLTPKMVRRQVHITFHLKS